MDANQTITATFQLILVERGGEELLNPQQNLVPFTVWAVKSRGKQGAHSRLLEEKRL